jgi:hypothetical protein
MDSIAQYHAHMAKLTRMGEHWHEKLWNGSGDWEGDRFLNIYHHPLKDEIEVRYEVPNEKAQLVFQIPLASFDIDKLCKALAHADNRKVSVEDKLVEVDAHNAVKEAEDTYVEEQHRDATIEKMHWAMQKDFHDQPGPISVPQHDVLD